MALAFLNGVGGNKRTDSQIIPIIDRSVEEIEIPRGVTRIGAYAFSYCRSLTKATVPSSVTHISEGAFMWCDSLVEFYMPDSVSTTEVSILSSCSSLQRVRLSNSLSRIYNNTFFKCSSLKDIYIPESVTNIGASSFNGCSSLIEISIPSKLTSIGSNAFNGCSSIIKYDFSKCKQVPTLNNVNAFSGINDNAQIVVPAFLYNEWTTATNWCQEGIVEHIVGTLDGTGGLEYSYDDTLGGYVVAGIGTCTDTEIVIPSMNENGNIVVGIGEHAFSNAEEVTKVTIPGSVYYLDDFCFSASVAEEIIFAAESGDSTRIICEAAFSFMRNVKLVDFTACKRIPVLNSSAIFTDAAYDDLEVRVPAELYDDWIKATNWTVYEEYIVPVA